MDWKVLLCDARDGYKTLEDESVQLNVTSPPYAQGLEYELGLDWDGLYALINDIANVSLRVTKPSGFFFVNFGETTKYFRTMADLYNETFRNAGWIMHSRRIWAKKFGACNLTGAMTARTIPAAEWENLWTFRKPPNSKEVHRDKTLSLRGIWHTQSDPEVDDRGHPAAFPLCIPSNAIRVWSDPDDLIVDPFCGTGTTGVAALGLCRRFVGFEICEKYYEISLKKIGGARLPLF